MCRPRSTPVAPVVQVTAGGNRAQLPRHRLLAGHLASDTTPASTRCNIYRARGHGPPTPARRAVPFIHAAWLSGALALCRDVAVPNAWVGHVELRRGVVVGTGVDLTSVCRLQHNACGAVCVIGCQELVRVEDCHLGAPAPGLDAERAVRQSHDNLAVALGALDDGCLDLVAGVQAGREHERVRRCPRARRRDHLPALWKKHIEGAVVAEVVAAVVLHWKALPCDDLLHKDKTCGVQTDVLEPLGAVLGARQGPREWVDTVFCASPLGAKPRKQAAAGPASRLDDLLGAGCDDFAAANEPFFAKPKAHKLDRGARCVARDSAVSQHIGGADVHGLARCQRVGINGALQVAAHVAAGAAVHVGVACAAFGLSALVVTEIRRYLTEAAAEVVTRHVDDADRRRVGVALDVEERLRQRAAAAVGRGADGQQRRQRNRRGGHKSRSSHHCGRFLAIRSAGSALDHPISAAHAQLARDLLL
mmetsp:Transcript_4816/g.14610  ORF Transcript_4816/g.14610 Transcript_4816/m.14610 type:complete len:476 (-) Transcript_4816:86-1513(-)